MEDLQSIKNSSDIELITRYRQSGNQSIVGELYERYVHLVFGVCMKYLQNHEDARDATLEVFEELLIKLRKHEVSNFKSWLYSVAKNHCLMKLRKGNNHVELKDNIAEIVENRQELHQQEAAGKEEQLKQLEDAIPLLNYEQRICVELFYLKERSYQEITEQTGFSFKEVKSYIQNGKRNLKNVLMHQHERKTF